MNLIETTTERPFTSKWSLHLLLLAILIAPVVAVAVRGSGGDMFMLAIAVPLVGIYAILTSIAVNAVTTKKSVFITHAVSLALLVVGCLLFGPK